jgi:hypothetical protein
LVSGAASNQEQLAVAAQNAVRTILQLTEAVKNGAAKLSPDSTEAQVMVKLILQSINNSMLMYRLFMLFAMLPLHYLI